jgi:hypothetical protein
MKKGWFFWRKTPWPERESTLLDLFLPLSLQGFVKAIADESGQPKELAIAVKLDRLPRGVEYDPAVVAHLEVRFERLLQPCIEFPVQVARNLPDDFPAPYILTT